MDSAWRKQLSVPDHLLEFYTQRWEKTLNIIPGPDWLRANGLTYLSYRRLLAQHFLIDWLIEEPADSVMISLEPSAKDEADHIGLVVRRPPRRLLADWARESGASCPPDFPGKCIERGEPTTLPASDSESFEITSEEIDNLPADGALAGWMMEKGPRHYGLDWSFESAFLEELQITGLAARLIAKARNG